MSSEVPQVKEEIAEKAIEILEADETNFSEQELMEFAANLSLQSFEPAQSVQPEELEAFMRALIESEQVEQVTEVTRGEIEDIKALVQESSREEKIAKASGIKDGAGVSLKEYFESDVAGIKKLMKERRLYVLRVGGKAASIIGYRKAKASMSDGRGIYEIKKASTLKKFAGKGYYRRLAGEVLGEIKEKFPDAVISRTTKSATVKKYCRSLPGWQSAGPMSSSHPIAKAIAIGTPEDYLKFADKEGYEVFFFDPRENRSPA